MTAYEQAHLEVVFALQLRRYRAEAEKAEVELETAMMVREHVRAVKRAADLPPIGGSRSAS